jgi:tetratricopeptide (TPR) repeat protein
MRRCFTQGQAFLGKKTLRLVTIGLAVALLLGCVCTESAAEQTLAGSAPQPVGVNGSAAPKEEFVAALRSFAEALPGSFGDEGSRVRASIDAMAKALDRWDASIRDNEKLAATQARNADARQALGIAYLDRGRVSEALREFTAAGQLGSHRADLYTLEGLAYGLANKPLSALRAFQKASALDSGDPRTSYRVALQLVQMGRPQEALGLLDRFTAAQASRLANHEAAAAVLFTRVDLLRPAVGVAPIFPPARYASGFASLRAGRYEEALGQFRTAAAGDPLSADPRSPADPVTQGAAVMRRGQIKPAVASLTASLETAVRPSETRRLLGIAYQADEQYDQSVEQFKAAIELDPLDERSRLALADVYLLMGRPSDAEQALNGTLQVLPASGQAHYGLARLFRAQQRHSDALREFELSAQAGPLVGIDYLLQAAIGIYFVQTDYDNAIRTYLKRIELNPNNVSAHRELGRTYMEQGRQPEALAELMAALLLKPDDAEALTYLGQCYLGMGRYEAAENASARALALDPTQKPARYVLGNSLTRLGRLEEGARELREFQRLQIAATEAANREWDLKMLRQEAARSIADHDYESAVRLLEQALPYEADSAAAHTTLAQILTRVGRYESAIEHFNKALALNGGPEILRELADLYERAGRPEDALRERAAYERAKQERLSRAGGNR